MGVTQVTGQQVKDGGITDADIASANKDGASATACMRTLGTGSAQACAGNDARLSDTRTPSALNAITAADPALTDMYLEYSAAASANRTVTLDRIGGFIDPQINDFRLSFDSSTGIIVGHAGGASLSLVPASAVSDNTTKARICIFDGTRHREYSSTAGVIAGISLTGMTPGMYDWFVYDNAGTLTLETTAWSAVSTGAITGATNATPIVITSTAHGLSPDDLVFISGIVGNTAANGVARIGTVAANTFQLLTLAGASVAGNGAYTSGGTWWRINVSPTRTTPLVCQDGVLYKSGALTRRYLGTLWIYQTGQGDDTDTNSASVPARRHLWNYYNRRDRCFRVNDATASWTTSTSTAHPWHSSLANRAEIVIGVAEDPVQVAVSAMAANATGGVSVNIGVGLDDLANYAVDLLNGGSAPPINVPTHLSANGQLQVTQGLHFLQVFEESGAGTTTFYGTGTGANTRYCGMSGSLRG